MILEMIVYYMSDGPLYGRENQDQNKENEPWWTQKCTVLEYLNVEVENTMIVLNLILHFAEIVQYWYTKIIARILFCIFQGCIWQSKISKQLNILVYLRNIVAE